MVYFPALRLVTCASDRGGARARKLVVVNSSFARTSSSSSSSSKQDPVAAAREYQEKAWAAYTARCSAPQ
jgi:hypothetical protein